MKRSSKFLYILAIISLPIQLQAASVNLVNPGFEDPLLANGVWTIGTVPGWSVIKPPSGPDAGVYNPPAHIFQSAVPEGNQIAFSNGATLSQILSEQIMGNTRYTLDVSVGMRLDAPLDGYEIQLLAAGNLLASLSSNISAHNAPIPGAGRFVDASLTYLSGTSYLGENLEIRLMSSGVQAIFDDVRLDGTAVNVSAVPLPAGFLLFGSGILSLIGAANRKRIQNI